MVEAALVQQDAGHNTELDIDLDGLNAATGGVLSRKYQGSADRRRTLDA